MSKKISLKKQKFILQNKFLPELLTGSNRKIISESPKQTQAIAAQLAKEILQSGLKKSAVVLTLKGYLGAGKTTFVQGFAKGLGIQEKILSSTFIIMRKYEIPNPKFQTNPKSKILNSKFDSRFKIQDSRFSRFYHFDCYRLQKSSEILLLDFKNIVADPKNIVAIEWPEKIYKELPKKGVLTIKLKHLKENNQENNRELTISQ